MRIISASSPDDALLPLQQHPGFGRALRLIGRNVAELALEDDGRTVGHVQLIGRGRLRLASRGPVWFDQRPADEVRAMAALRRALPSWSALIVNAERPATGWQSAGFLPLMTPAWVAEWTLSGDLRATLTAKWRNRLARGENAGWTVRHEAFPADADHWLLQREAAQSASRGYRSWPGIVAAAFAKANPGCAHLFTAERQRHAAAAVLVLRHGRAATYHVGWSSIEGRAGQAHNLLLWRAAEWLSAHGVQRLDLGTVDTTTSPGLAHFKLGTGAVARPLGGTWGAVAL